MSFNEVQFPLTIPLGSVGGPEFSTNIATTKNGSEQRNVNWSQARLRFNVASRIKSQSDFDIIKDFFYAQKGRAHGFLFKDWSDYQAVGQLIATGDGSKTDFQLQKTYSSLVNQTVRTITKPVASSVKIYLDSVLQISGFSVDSTTGIISFTTAPQIGEIISADFEFNVPMRFDIDNLDIAINSKSSYEIKDIPLIEIKY